MSAQIILDIIPYVEALNILNIIVDMLVQKRNITHIVQL